MIGLLIQEVKTLFKSPASISILVIPLVLLVGLGYLLPSGWIVPSSITIGIVGAVLLYFGGSIEEIKRTSFMKSISLTRLSKLSFLATKILFSIFVSMIAVLWVLFFSWVFTTWKPVAFLATNFGNLLPHEEGATVTNIIRGIPFDIDWGRVEWFQMLYAGMMTIVIAVSLSFVFVAFAKSSLSFYLMSFGYLLAMILFGGVVMPGFLISSDNSWFKNLYYLVPNYYTNNVMAYSFSGGIGPSLVNSISDTLEGVGNGIADTSIAHLLTMHIDQSIIGNASEADIQSVTDFLTKNGSHGLIGKSPWNYSMADLDTWYASVTHSEYIDAVYQVLSTPAQHGFDSWQAYMGESLKNIGNPIVKLFIDGGLPSFVWNQLGSLLMGDNVLAKSIEAAIKIALNSGNISSEMAKNLKTLIDSLNGSIGNLLNTVATAGVNPASNIAIGPISVPTLKIVVVVLQNAGLVFNAIGPILHSLIGNVAPGISDTLAGMFAKPGGYNYILPWIETSFFLGIAVVFFKWS